VGVEFGGQRCLELLDRGVHCGENAEQTDDGLS